MQDIPSKMAITINSSIFFVYKLLIFGVSCN
jgi:hypothetical protein